jgi:sugar (pentulose or hexulose) kinase
MSTAASTGASSVIDLALAGAAVVVTGAGSGIGFYAGFALRWLRDRAAAGRPAGRTPGYAELEELAAVVPPGAGGLAARLVPADAWTWARWQPPFPPRPGAALAGLGEQARAIQEAAAYSTRRAAGLLTELLGPGAWHEVILTGGAARSRLWPQTSPTCSGIG